jgi:hemerythrin-like domain-containing protein
MKRSHQLEPLSHDHFDGLLVARRLEKGLARDAAASELAGYADSFWQNHLARHFELEEEVLMPVLAAHHLHNLIDRLRTEHRQIRVQFETLVADSGDNAAEKETVRELVEMMKAHIRFEERELFPAIENSASVAELSEVGRSLTGREEEADLDWDLVFWE